MKNESKFGARRGRERGFTLVEMLIATVIVIVGLVAVAQLVPTSVLMNANNRNDGTALVFAQREMEMIREQPITAATFTDSTGITCPSTCNLGDATQPNVIIGSPVVTNSAGVSMIDFSTGQVGGYSFTYIDPNDPFSAPYDVRWAVVTTTTTTVPTVVTGKRIIVGVFRRGMQTPSLPITLDTMVQK